MSGGGEKLSRRFFFWLFPQERADGKMNFSVSGGTRRFF